MLLTVAVCTWKRARRLDTILQNIYKLETPKDADWELLVINNNCTDDTDDVLSRHADHLPLRRLSEEKLGHCNARNCAIDGARGELIVWTDDDVLVDPQWLVAYAGAARSNPKASFFGGPIAPWFPVDPPAWVQANPNVFRVLMRSTPVQRRQ